MCNLLIIFIINLFVYIILKTLVGEERPNALALPQKHQISVTNLKKDKLQKKKIAFSQVTFNLNQKNKKSIQKMPIQIPFHSPVLKLPGPSTSIAH